MVKSKQPAFILSERQEDKVSLIFYNLHKLIKIRKHLFGPLISITYTYFEMIIYNKNILGQSHS